MPSPAPQLSKVWMTIAMGLASAAITGCASHPKPMAPTAMTPSPPPPAQHYSPPPQAAVQTGPLPGTVQDFVVNVGDRVYFDYDKFVIRPDAAARLAAQANWLNRYPSVHVRIEGNADERGTEDYNFALGAKRADAVKTFLVEHEVSPSRITTISYGKERPIDPGTGETAWSHNRNAHTAITEGSH